MPQNAGFVKAPARRGDGWFRRQPLSKHHPYLTMGKEDLPMSTPIPQCGIDLIKEFEGYHERLADDRAAAYPDPITGWELPTIGYGTTKYADGRPVRKGDIITRVEAEEHLKWEVEQVCRPALEKIPTWEQMNEHQRGALYSFAYNLGAYFYRGKNFQSITKVCDSPERWSEAEWIKEQFVKYRSPGTDAEAGLLRRRKAEADLFCRPV
jgi:GH24 family phage-related lysozyme (muramidase)